jgi:hypothetical protein
MMSLAHEAFSCPLGPRFGAESAPPQMAIVNTATDMLKVLEIGIDCAGNCSPMKAPLV